MATGAIGAMWANQFAAALKSTMSAGKAALTLNRVELGKHLYARAASGVGKKMLWVGTKAPFAEEDRELAGPIGMVIAAHMGNAVWILENIEDWYGQ